MIIGNKKKTQITIFGNIVCIYRPSLLNQLRSSELICWFLQPAKLMHFLENFNLQGEMMQLIPFLFFALIYQILVSSNLTIARSHLCLVDQSRALLQFKEGITVDESASLECEASSPKTESWNSTTDCCRYNGRTT